MDEKTPTFPLRDAHLHLSALDRHEPWQDPTENRGTDWQGLSSCHSPEDWAWHLERCPPQGPFPFWASYGVHPQEPDPAGLDFLEELLASGHPLLRAVGEGGYDFFDHPDEEGPRGSRVQEKVFCAQLALAARYRLPLVIHLRKATDRIFTHLEDLKKVPSVIFHSWPSGGNEALALLKRGVNAWFSLGTPLMRGNKKTLDTLLRLPADRILLETDAPWQTLKGQTFTPRMAILEVYGLAARLRQTEISYLADQVCTNFHNALGK